MFILRKTPALFRKSEDYKTKNRKRNDPPGRPADPKMKNRRRFFEVIFQRTPPLFFSEKGKHRTQMFILSKTPALFRKSEDNKAKNRKRNDPPAGPRIPKRKTEEDILR